MAKPPNTPTPSERPRRVIQIAVSEVEDSWTPMALCDDSTIWRFQAGEDEWIQLPSVSGTGP